MIARKITQFFNAKFVFLSDVVKGVVLANCAVASMSLRCINPFHKPVVVFTHKGEFATAGANTGHRRIICTAPSVLAQGIKAMVHVSAVQG